MSTRRNGDLPAQRQHEQVPQRIDHRAADRAAQAAALDQHDVVLGQAHQVVVHAHVAILVDDHHRVRIGRFLQQAVEQRRLAAAQKPGQYGHADAFFFVHEPRFHPRHPPPSRQTITGSLRPPQRKQARPGRPATMMRQTRDASQSQKQPFGTHNDRPLPAPRHRRRGCKDRSHAAPHSLQRQAAQDMKTGHRKAGIGKQASKRAQKRAPEKPKGPLTCVSGPKIFGSPSWARTSDLRINSPSLYRLSYRGTAKKRDYERKF